MYCYLLGHPKKKTFILPGDGGDGGDDDDDAEVPVIRRRGAAVATTTGMTVGVEIVNGEDKISGRSAPSSLAETVPFHSLRLAGST